MSVFVAVVFQHAMRLRHIVICGLHRSTIFFTFSHKRNNFEKKKLLNTKYVSITFIGRLVHSIV